MGLKLLIRLIDNLLGICKYNRVCKLYRTNNDTCNKTRGYWKRAGTFDEEEANCRRKLDEKEEGLAKQLKIGTSGRSSGPYHSPF